MPDVVNAFSIQLSNKETLYRICSILFKEDVSMTNIKKKEKDEVSVRSAVLLEHCVL